MTSSEKMAGSLPTDNLYKFLAIGSIALALTGSAQMMALRNESSRLLARAEELEAEVKVAESEIERRDRTFRPDLLPDRTPEEVKEALSSIRSYASAVEESRKSMLKLHADARRVVAEFGALPVDHMERFFWMSTLGGALFGVSLCAWWFKHQRYQDMLVKAAAEEAVAKRRRGR